MKKIFVDLADGTNLLHKSKREASWQIVFDHDVKEYFNKANRKEPHSDLPFDTFLKLVHRLITDSLYFDCVHCNI